MKVKITYNGKLLSEILAREGTDESGFWKPVAEEIFRHKYPEPGEICIETEDHRTAIIKVEEEDGRISLKPDKCHIWFSPSLYGVKKLRKVDLETGSHVFYDIVPNNMGPRTIDVGARFGQTGAKNAGADIVSGAFVLKRPYQTWFYWFKYFALLAAGYDDMTDEMYDEEEEIAELQKMFGDPDDIPLSDEDDLVLRVNDFFVKRARQSVSETINVDWLSNKLPFNRRMVNSAWKAWNKFKGVHTAETANEVIAKLIKVTDVSFEDGKSKKKLSDFLVPEVDDPEEQKKLIEKRIDEWETFIRSMEGVLPAQTEKNGEKIKVVSPFGNISMKAADEKETERIRKKFRIQPEYSFKYIQVDAPDFRERFDAYIKAKGIEVTDEFIHGSSTANWKSIIMNGLLLNPDAPIHGKAFGHGIYTARDFYKSLGYTDFNGSKWAHGEQDVGVIGVYRAAYGKPFIPKNGEFGEKCKSIVEKGGYNCLDYKSQYGRFMMDEIIFYQEPALYLEGLIVFCNKGAEDAIKWAA